MKSIILTNLFALLLISCNNQNDKISDLTSKVDSLTNLLNEKKQLYLFPIQMMSGCDGSFCGNVSLSKDNSQIEIKFRKLDNNELKTWFYISTNSRSEQSNFYLTYHANLYSKEVDFQEISECYKADKDWSCIENPNGIELQESKKITKSFPVVEENGDYMITIPLEFLDNKLPNRVWMAK